MLFLLAQVKSTPISSIDWGKWSVIISIISLIVVFLLGIIQIKISKKATRNLEIIILSKVPLVKIEKGFKEQLKVSYQGHEIKDATSLTFRIRNSGKKAILPKDFIRPLSFSFSPEAKIISAEVLKTEPENIGSSISKRDKYIELQPLLMNTNDSLDITAVVESFKNKTTIDGRIVGIKILRIEEKLLLAETKEDRNKLEIIKMLLISLVITILVNFNTLISPWLFLNDIAKSTEIEVKAARQSILGHLIPNIENPGFPVEGFCQSPRIKSNLEEQAWLVSVENKNYIKPMIKKEFCTSGGTVSRGKYIIGAFSSKLYAQKFAQVARYTTDDTIKIYISKNPVTINHFKI